MADIDVVRQVLEYLSKKGYNRTEAMLRMESANQDVDGRPIQTRIEESGGVKYGKAFGAKGILWCPQEHAHWFIDLFRNWIEENLEIYKVISPSK